MGFPGGAVLKNPPAYARDARDANLILGSGISPGVGNGNPLQCACLATVHEVAESQTWLSVCMYTHTHGNIIALKYNGIKSYLCTCDYRYQIQFSRSVVSNCLWSHGLQHTRLLHHNSWSLLKLMSIESVMPSSHLRLCRPLLLLPSIFPSVRVFSKKSQFFASGGQSIGALVSVSVLPINVQDWFPLGLTGLILQSKGLSRAFSNPTVQKHQSLSKEL